MHSFYRYGRGGCREFMDRHGMGRHGMDHHGMGRHPGGRGGGRFSAGFMGSRGFGGGDFRMGRKLGSADLQLLILALLAEKPCHGYELIKALEERSSGFYSPSPGMIYPALTYLEELGHARVEAEGTRKLYHVTEEGRRHLEQNRAVVDSILQQLEQIGRKMDRVRRVFADEAGLDEAGVTEEGDTESSAGARGRAFRDLWLARRELEIALRENKHATPAEHKRITEILQRAVAEIRASDRGSGATKDR
jgi:DNA-binding PadR family transcriptional regulator